MSAHALRMDELGTNSVFLTTKHPPYQLVDWAQKSASYKSIEYILCPMISISAPLRQNTYCLNKEEQTVFRSVLRKSVKILHKA